MPHVDIKERRAYARAWRAKNRWRYLEHERTYSQARHANRRAKLADVPGQITTDDVRRILAVGECFYCGATEVDLTLDHSYPMELGGPNTVDNILAACDPCNKSKQQSDEPWRWARAWDRCRDCGTDERTHAARGRCNACYLRSRK